MGVLLPPPPPPRDSHFYKYADTPYLWDGHCIPAVAIKLSLPSNSYNYKREQKTVEMTKILPSSRMAYT